MRANKLLKRIMLIVTFLAITFLPVTTFANESKVNPIENEPNKVLTWYVEVRKPYSGNFIFHRVGQYRGWLAVSNSGPNPIYQGVELFLYKGTLYHDSVNTIPAPTREIPIEEIQGSDEELRSSKFISKVYRIPCRWDEYCAIPTSVFYNDGKFKGYLYYKESYPAYKKENYIEVTYKGYVYTGDYPAPTKVKDIAK